MGGALDKDLERAASLFAAFTGAERFTTEEVTLPASVRAPSALCLVGDLLLLELADGSSFCFDKIRVATGPEGKGLYFLGSIGGRLPVAHWKSGKAERLKAIGYRAKRSGRRLSYKHEFERRPLVYLDRKTKTLRVTGGAFRFTDRGIVG